VLQDIDPFLDRRLAPQGLQQQYLVIVEERIGRHPLAAGQQLSRLAVEIRAVRQEQQLVPAVEVDEISNPPAPGQSMAPALVCRCMSAVMGDSLCMATLRLSCRGR
jgi:hypothetical protein